MSNIDNMGATVDLKILAQCIQNKNEVIKPGREQYSLLLDCGGSSSGGAFDCVTKRPRFESGSWAFFRLFFPFVSWWILLYKVPQGDVSLLMLLLRMLQKCFSDSGSINTEWVKKMSHLKPHTTNHRKCPPGTINCWMSRLYLLAAIFWLAQLSHEE